MAGVTPGYPFTTFDTVLTDTPAACATSFNRDSATGSSAIDTIRQEGRLPFSLPHLVVHWTTRAAGGWASWGRSGLRIRIRAVDDGLTGFPSHRIQPQLTAGRDESHRLRRPCVINDPALTV